MDSLAVDNFPDHHESVDRCFHKIFSFSFFFYFLRDRPGTMEGMQFLYPQKSSPIIEDRFPVMVWAR